jgi:hypothetical protein
MTECVLILVGAQQCSTARHRIASTVQAAHLAIFHQPPGLGISVSNIMTEHCAPVSLALPVHSQMSMFACCRLQQLCQENLGEVQLGSGTCNLHYVRESIFVPECATR